MQPDVVHRANPAAAAVARQRDEPCRANFSRFAELPVAGEFVPDPSAFGLGRATSMTAPKPSTLPQIPSG